MSPRPLIWEMGEKLPDRISYKKVTLAVMAGGVLTCAIIALGYFAIGEYQAHRVRQESAQRFQLELKVYKLEKSLESHSNQRLNAVMRLARGLASVPQVTEAYCTEVATLSDVPAETSQLIDECVRIELPRLASEAQFQREAL